MAYVKNINGYDIKDEESRNILNNLFLINENDHTDINLKFKNFKLTIDRYQNTTLYILHLKNIDKIEVFPTGGNTSSPQLNATNIKDYVQSHNKYDIVVNGGAFNIDSNEPIGYCIFNRIPYTPNDLGSSYIYYGGFDEENNLLIKKGSEVNNINDLINLGFINCIGGFTALYENGEPITQTENIQAILQTIVQLNNDEYLLISSTGREEQNQGLSYDDMITYLSNYDVKTAFSLDGGGSTQTYYNKKSILNPQDINKNRVNGRIVPTAVGIILKEVL